MDSLETKPSLDFPETARLIAVRVIDAGSEVSVEEAAQAIIRSARQARGVRKRCAFPTQPQVRRLQTR